jgi:serine/threonine protein kinase/predicted heme/steroid binding protein
VEGTPFGRYRLIDLLGRGGMGEVWRAHDSTTNRIVAIKVLPAQCSDDPTFRQRFRREAHSAARLNSPHVIPIYDHGEIEGRLFVSMRLVEGRDLQAVLSDRPLAPQRAVRIIDHVARALHAAHRAGLVHRDVKPSNVLLDENDFAYLIDFGIARATDDTRITATGNAIGTFQYMAPERWGDGPDDARGDIYALACVLYECLTGQPPFAGSSMASLVAAHLIAPPPQPSKTAPDVPAAFDAVIAIGMAKDPEARYLSVNALAQAARAAVAPDHSSPTLPAADAAASAPTRLRPLLAPSPTTSREHAVRKNRALIVGAATILAVVIVVVGYTITQRGGGTTVTAGTPPSNASTSPSSGKTFDRAKRGDCLNWPDRTPDSAEIVDCTDDHRFEVAEAIDMSTFPGSEYGPDAAPPSTARIQQISQEQCSAAVKQYLGTQFDPNSRYTVSMLWSGEEAWRHSGERRMLCGLQLPGPYNQQLAYKGKVADVDQSKVWSPGTCLGIDPATNQPTDIPVDCSAPHAMEVTGSINLGERFPGALPPEPEQDGFIKDACTRMTDAYLAPVQLRSTTLTLIYSTISLPSWSAGSRQVACSVGATLGNGGWSTLLNSAKGPLLINGQPPVPP